MPWQEVSRMSQRQEFVMLAQAEGCNRRALCRHFGISPKTGYKWLQRDAADPEMTSYRLTSNMYYPSLRTPVTLVSGPYTLKGKANNERHCSSFLRDTILPCC